MGAGLGEFGGCVLTLLGLGGPIGPALIVMVMVAAIFSVHISKGFWAQDGGYELPVMYISTALALAFAGFGVISLDRALGLAVLGETAEIWSTLALGALLGGLNLLARRPATTQKPVAQ